MAVFRHERLFICDLYDNPAERDKLNTEIKFYTRLLFCPLTVSIDNGKLYGLALFVPRLYRKIAGAAIGKNLAHYDIEGKPRIRR